MKVILVLDQADLTTTLLLPLQRSGEQRARIERSTHRGRHTLENI